MSQFFYFLSFLIYQMRNVGIFFNPTTLKHSSLGFLTGYMFFKFTEYVYLNQNSNFDKIRNVVNILV